MEPCPQSWSTLCPQSAWSPQTHAHLSPDASNHQQRCQSPSEAGFRWILMSFLLLLLITKSISQVHSNCDSEGNRSDMCRYSQQLSGRTRGTGISMGFSTFPTVPSPILNTQKCLPQCLLNYLDMFLTQPESLPFLFIRFTCPSPILSHLYPNNYFLWKE